MSPKTNTIVTANGLPVVACTHARFLRATPRKVRLVADQIRNKTVGQAIRILEFLHRPSATPHVRQALLSAAKNAEAVHPTPEDLVIGELRVDGGPTLKRMRPCPMGRASRIRKRTCHIHLFLTEQK